MTVRGLSTCAAPARPPRRTRWRTLGLSALLATSATVATTATVAHAQSGTIGLSVVISGTEDGAAFTIDPSGRIWYAQRHLGSVRIFNPATKTNTLFATVPHVVSKGERGLLGVALDPAYPTVPDVYLSATVTEPDGNVHMVVDEYADTGGTGAFVATIYDSGPLKTWPHDQGGRLLFGPDGDLYLTEGQSGSGSFPQDLTVPFGKILRMNPDGSAPATNPFAGSPFPTDLIYAFGIRNSFGLTFDPLTGNLWETEPGPSCNDEINLITSGSNYGWGDHAKCGVPPPAPLNTNQDGPLPRVLPEWFFATTITPVGIAFCNNCGLGAGFEGEFFFGGWETNEVYAATLDPTRTMITAVTPELTLPVHPNSLEVAPDGTVYVGTASTIYKLVLG